MGLGIGGNTGGTVETCSTVQEPELSASFLKALNNAGVLTSAFSDCCNYFFSTLLTCNPVTNLHLNYTVVNWRLHIHPPLIQPAVKGQLQSGSEKTLVCT